MVLQGIWRLLLRKPIFCDFSERGRGVQTPCPLSGSAHNVRKFLHLEGRSYYIPLCKKTCLWGLLTCKAQPALLSWMFMHGSRGYSRGSRPHPPSINHKNIGFLSNTSLDPLKNHKATKPASHVGPPLAHQRNAI